MAQITKEQYRELLHDELYDYEEFMCKLEKYTGIEARARSAYQFYDAAGDYIGDSEDDLDALLEAAYVEVK